MKPLNPRSHRRPLIAVLLTVASFTPALAETVPAGGTAFITPDTTAPDAFLFRDGGLASHEIVPVSGMPFSQAHRVEVHTPPETSNFWTIALQTTSTRPVAEDDVALLHFHLRSPYSGYESGEGFAQVYVERNEPPHTKSINFEVRAGPEWQEFFLPFSMLEDRAAGALTLNFGFAIGDRRMTLEIGGIEAIHYGSTRTIAELPRTSFQYGGREPGAPWRSEAAQRIGQFRKGNFTVEVVDAHGNPVQGVPVEVEMTRHAFEFGTAVDPRDYMNDAAYRGKILENFNAISNENALKWPPWIGEWGNHDRETTQAGFQFMVEHGLATRGHVLVWPGERNLPDAIVPLLAPDREDELRQVVLDHIDDITQAMKGLVNEWDVVNEPYSNHDIMDITGDDVLVDWFDRAAANLPGGRFYLNDYGILSAGGRDTAHQAHFEATLRFLLENGAPITGIGLQGHMGGSPTDLPLVYEILERYASLGLDIRITEFDVDTTDEALQADYTRDFLTLVFSHPAVVGWQCWGFYAGDHWRPAAAMFREDWSEKPNGTAYRQLVYGDWWTREQGITDSRGRVAGRGFHGDHVVRTTVDGKIIESTFRIEPDKPQNRVRVVLDETLADLRLERTPGDAGVTWQAPDPEREYILQRSDDLQSWTAADAWSGAGDARSLDFDFSKRRQFMRLHVTKADSETR